MSVFKDVDAIPRDRWGRPLIQPLDGGKPRPYTRVSTLAKVLDDKTALTRWKQRQTAVGLAARPDLIALVAAKKGDRKAVDEAVEEAMTAAGSSKGANLGTALHQFTEDVDTGTLDWDQVDPTIAADLRAYEVAMDGITVLKREVFVVQDDLECAGSFDKLVALPDGRLLVADVKTGQNEPAYPHGAATQIAVYAHGTTYIHPAGRGVALKDAGVDLQVGLLIHLPAGQARCDLYLVDIARGWFMAGLACDARDWLKAKPIERFTA